MYADMTEEERAAHVKEVLEWWRNYKSEIAEGKRRAVVHTRWQLEAGAVTWLPLPRLRSRWAGRPRVLASRSTRFMNSLPRMDLCSDRTVRAASASA